MVKKGKQCIHKSFETVQAAVAEGAGLEECKSDCRARADYTVRLAKHPFEHFTYECYTGAVDGVESPSLIYGPDRRPFSLTGTIEQAGGSLPPSNISFDVRTPHLHLSGRSGNGTKQNRIQRLQQRGASLIASMKDCIYDTTETYQMS